MALYMSKADVDKHQARVHGKKLTKNVITTKRSNIESSFAQQLKLRKLPDWVEEYRFHCTRKWRLDFAWPELLIAAEVEGLVRNATQGGHQTMKGYTANCEKYNSAMLHGWAVYRFTNPMVKSGEAAEFMQRVLGRRETEFNQR